VEQIQLLQHKLKGEYSLEWLRENLLNSAKIEIDTLKRNINEKTYIIDNIQNELHSVDQKNENIINNFRNEINNLNSKVNKLEIINNKYKNENDKFESDINNKVTTQSGLVIKVTNLENQIDIKNSEIKK